MIRSQSPPRSAGRIRRISGALQDRLGQTWPYRVWYQGVLGALLAVAGGWGDSGIGGVAEGDEVRGATARAVQVEEQSPGEGNPQPDPAVAGQDVVRGEVAFAPATVQLPVAVPFRLERQSFAYELTRLTDRPFGLEESALTFPSPMTTPQVANNTVHCEYFAPRGDGKRPGVIVLHILGGDFPLSRLCCRMLASNGVGALFVKMPYYGPRREPRDRTRMISADLDQTVRGMTQAVLDIQFATAWLAARPEIDSQRLGITGISLGGIVAALAAESEPRLQRVFLVLAGGHFGRVAWESTELADAKVVWVADGLTLESISETIRPVDPITYAANLRDRELVMINASRDEVIPRECAESLWRAAGEPRIIWWNATHYSAAWRLPGGLSEMAEFFARDVR